MDEFERIYNSIYANDHLSDDSENQEIKNNPNNDYNYSDNTSSSPSLKSESTEDDFFAAYDSHRRQIVSDSIYSSEAFDSTVTFDIQDEDNLDEKIEIQSSILDYDQSSDNYNDELSLDEMDLSDYDEDFSAKSFKDYLSAQLAGLIIKLRGGVPPEATTSTGEEDIDELGNEIPLLSASKYYGSHVHSLRLRTRVSFIVLLILAYISVGLPVTGRLNNIIIASITCMALQFNIILLALDVFTNGITNMFRKRFGADSLCVISCLVTTIDALLVITEQTDPHIPLCLVSSFSLFGLLLSSLLCSRGFRKALRVPGIGSTHFTVTGEIGVTGKEITLLKSKRKIEGFLRRIEEEPIDENIYRRISLLFIVFSIFLTVIIAFIKKNYLNSVYIFSAVFSISVPFTSLLCYSLPFFIGAHRLFPFGAAIAGWSGITDIGHSKNLIITGRDLFPSNTVSIEGVRIFADYDSNKVISYACAMIRESKCDLDVAFEELGKENNAEDLRVDNFECLSSGGLKGMIEGKTILCGNTDFMKLMDIKTPSRLIEGTSVLLAINGVLYGIFNLKYKPDPKVRKALVSLMQSNRHAIFAVRDFNITPDMLHDCFDIATDGYDFPAYMDRFPLSEAKPANDSKIAGILCRGGLEPLIKLADTGRSLFVITNTNLVISIIGAFLGAILVTIALLFGNGITVLGMFLYQLVSAAPIIILSLIGSTIK